MGVPLYSKSKVIGLLALSRSKNAFTEDDGLIATTFSMQAIVALENARLYDEVTGINQMMERMVSQRVEELNTAYNTLSKHDKNKSAFIQVRPMNCARRSRSSKAIWACCKPTQSFKTTPCCHRQLMVFCKARIDCIKL